MMTSKRAKRAELDDVKARLERAKLPVVTTEDYDDATLLWVRDPNVGHETLLKRLQAQGIYRVMTMHDPAHTRLGQMGLVIREVRE
jgi:hypothetical protein